MKNLLRKHGLNVHDVRIPGEPCKNTWDEVKGPSKTGRAPWVLAGFVALCLGLLVCPGMAIIVKHQVDSSGTKPKGINVVCLLIYYCWYACINCRSCFVTSAASNPILVRSLLSFLNPHVWCHCQKSRKSKNGNHKKSPIVTIIVTIRLVLQSHFLVILDFRWLIVHAEAQAQNDKGWPRVAFWHIGWLRSSVPTGKESCWSVAEGKTNIYIYIEYTRYYNDTV